MRLHICTSVIYPTTKMLEICTILSYISSLFENRLPANVRITLDIVSH